MFFDLYKYQFRSWRITFFGDTIDRYEYIGFRIISYGAPLWNVVWNDYEKSCGAFSTFIKIK